MLPPVTFGRAFGGKNTCDLCQRDIYYLSEHNKYCRKVVPPEGGFSRNICGKSFLRKRYLKEHCRCKHQSQEQYECEILAINMTIDDLFF